MLKHPCSSIIRNEGKPFNCTDTNILYPSRESVTITGVPIPPLSYNSELIFNPSGQDTIHADYSKMKSDEYNNNCKKIGERIRFQIKQSEQLFMRQLNRNRDTEPEKFVRCECHDLYQNKNYTHHLESYNHVRFNSYRQPISKPETKKTKPKPIAKPKSKKQF